MTFYETLGVQRIKPIPKPAPLSPAATLQASMLADLLRQYGNSKSMHGTAWGF